MDNTGILSLILYGFFTLLAIIAFYLIIKQIKEIDTTTANADNEIKKIDKITEIAKYVIVSIIISTVTLVVSDQFKERDYDKKEMEAFNTYIPYVIDTTSTLDNKINLCQFFSSVTPKGDLKDGWKQYTSYLLQQKDSVETIQKTIDSISVKSLPNEQEISILKEAQSRKEKLLNNVNAIETVNYLVIIGADKTPQGADDEVKWVLGQGYSNATIYKKSNWFRTVIPVNTNFDDANRIANEIKEKAKRAQKDKTPYVVTLKTWCNNPVYLDKEKCFICNN